MHTNIGEGILIWLRCVFFELFVLDTNWQISIRSLIFCLIENLASCSLMHPGSLVFIHLLLFDELIKEKNFLKILEQVLYDKSGESREPRRLEYLPDSLILQIEA
jgi:hypothetical protein